MGVVEDADVAERIEVGFAEGAGGDWFRFVVGADTKERGVLLVQFDRGAVGCSIAPKRLKIWALDGISKEGIFAGLKTVTF